MKKLFLFLLVSLLAIQQAIAQTHEKNTGQVEVFCGAELLYADTNWLRLFDVQVNATPGVRWHLGNDWTIAAQGLIPVVSDGYTYRDVHNKFWRGNMAVLSKQLHFNKVNQHVKLTGGWFSNKRYGADVRWMWPVTDWLLLQAQAGLTAYWMLGTDFKGNYRADLDESFTLTGMAGANVFLPSWNIEFRASVGRYVAGDYGSQVDVMRHFGHCTLLMFAQLRMGERLASEFDSYTHSTNGGFKVIMMLPPYKKSTKKWVVRPASNFRLTNNLRADQKPMKLYTTDPEENERELPMDVKWGINGDE